MLLFWWIGGLRGIVYFISCSSRENMSEVKNSFRLMSRPSDSFFRVIMDMSFLFSLNRLYTVDGVTPERVANSLGAMPFSSHSSSILFTMAGFMVIYYSFYSIVNKYSQQRIRTVCTMCCATLQGIRA